MHLAILPFHEISIIDLENLARRSVPNAKLRKPGASQFRYRSYLAGRCAISILFKTQNLDYRVKPNIPFGFLEVVDPNGISVKNLYMNISHTDEVSVAVLSNNPVGIDIENRDRNAMRVLSRIATEREKDWVNDQFFVSQKLEVRRDIFLWSSKEAASKAFGLGMKFGLKTFEILPHHTGPNFRVSTNTNGPLKVDHPVVEFGLWDKYVITVCGAESSVLRGVDRRIIGMAEVQAFR